MVDWKLDIAKKCGADIVLNPGKCNLMEEINKLTDGLGCDVYIEATGAGGSVKFVGNFIIEPVFISIFCLASDGNNSLLGPSPNEVPLLARKSAVISLCSKNNRERWGILKS